MISRVRTARDNPSPPGSRALFTNSGAASWRGDVDADGHGGVAKRSRHSRPWRQASRRAQNPMGTMRPVSSARGMNSAGDSGPRVVGPAQQGLEAGEAAASPDRRSVGSGARARCAQGAVQVGLRPQARLRSLPHGAIEHLVARRGQCPGAVQGGRRVADRLLGVLVARAPGTIPIRAPTTTSWPSIQNGRSMAASAFSARRAASAGSSRPSRRIANSSPPRWVSEPQGRRSCSMRRLISSSSRSPRNCAARR